MAQQTLCWYPHVVCCCLAQNATPRPCVVAALSAQLSHRQLCRYVGVLSGGRHATGVGSALAATYLPASCCKCCATWGGV